MTPRVAQLLRAANDDLSLDSNFAEDVRDHLTRKPRQLPSRYLYDDLGSALFDAICELPWYRITRAEMRLLGEHGPRIWEDMEPLDRVIELGPGDGRKLAALMSRRPRRLAPLRVDLVDISTAALDTTASALARIGISRVVRHAATYEAGIEAASGSAPRGRALVLFLGSNIGNYEPASADALLRHVRRRLVPGDALLLGADLVKPEPELLQAYDDPLGVTRAFNLNLLARINEALGADFDLGAFEHRAVWNARASRVEMHLVSARRQSVRIPGAELELELEAWETIWTESSYKYLPDDVVRLVGRAGFEATGQWQDERAGFALTLCEVPPGASENSPADPPRRGGDQR
jgi:dimethylhistidine N-methyltransferase